MKYSSDYKAIALNALKGKWTVAIFTGFLASLMGGTLGVASVSSNSRSSGSDDAYIREMISTTERIQLGRILMVMLIIALVWLLITIVIGGAAKLGYAKFNLKLVDGEEVTVSDLFSQFDRLGDGFGMKFGIGLYTFLWSMLFIIPGIIKSYSYSMTPFILAERPGMKVDTAITESRRIMDGNKWNLFCLNFSFIGWELLIVAPAVILLMMLGNFVIATENIFMAFWAIPCLIPTYLGSLVLQPYMTAAMAAFYREISFVKGMPEFDPYQDYFEFEE